MMMALLFVPPAWSGEQQQHDNPDPWEGFNRKVFVFNDTFDRYLLKPLARGYMVVMPDWADRGLYNFFGNLTEPRVIVNGLLQGKFRQAGSDGLRFVLNSTVGLLGFIDVASRFDLRKHDEDFGQSLGVWGLSSGPYLVLPLLGPSTVRDGVGLAPDFMLDPIARIDEDETRYAVIGFKAVIVRAHLLSSEKLISGDRYLFIRDAYLQNREFLTKGQTRDPFLDESDE
jgi:phospholipid-binding lipoprotein MlaA